MADDVVASASVTVEPDLSNFGAALQAALGPALAEAVAAVNDATAAMASEAGGNAEALGSAIDSAIAPAAEAAAAAIADASLDMESSLEGVAGATEGMAGEIDAAVDAAASALEGEIASAAGVAADGVASASTDMTAALADVSASASDTGSEVEGAGASFQAFAAQGTASVTSMADMIKAVALGSLIADGIQGGVEIALESIQNLVTAIPSIGEGFHRAFQQIRVGTGATGAELAGMEQSLRDVYAKTPAGMGEVANALQLLSQRLGITGDQAEGIALTMIRLARITGSDVNTTVDQATAIFNNFGVAAADQTAQLDKFLRISQETGVPVDQLLASVQSSGLAFKAAGFSIDEAAAIIGNLSKVGLDASAVQLALGRATARAAKEGIPARQAFDALFDSIKNAPSQMAATAAATEAFGQRAGPRLAELIRSGKLSYEELTASIQAGGDTIEQAAKDTGTWRGALATLGHVIENALQPVATAVFNGMNTAIRALTPIVGQLATAAGAWLAPAWESVMRAGKPVWDLLDKIRASFAAAADAITKGLGPLGAVQAFFKALTGNDEIAQRVGDALRGVGQALSDLWARLQPVRDAIGEVFDRIRGAVEAFVAANPEAVLAGVGVALAGITGAAVLAGLSALGGLLATAATALWGLVAPALAAAAPFIAVGVAVAALIAGFKYAYENFEWFRTAVDTVASVLRDGLLAALEIVTGFVEARVMPWLTDMGERFSALWDAISSFDFDDIIGSLGTLAGSLGPVLSGLIAEVPRMMLDLASTLVDSLLSALTSLPVVGQLVQVFRQWFGDLTLALGGAFDIIGGLLSFDTAKIGAGVDTMLRAIGDAVVNGIPALFDAVGNLGGFAGMLLDKLVGLVKGLPIVGPLVQAIRDLIVNAFAAVGSLGDLLSGLFTFDGEKILAGLSGLGQTVVNALLAVLSNLPALLADRLSLLASGVGTVFGEWLPKAITGASDLFRSGLQQAFQFLKDLPSIIGNLIVTYGPDVGRAVIGGILAGLKFAVRGLPKWIVTEALPALVGAIIEHGPDVLAAFGDLLGKLPGLLGSVVGNLGGILKDILFGLGDVILSWAGQLGSLLVTAFTAGWDWLVQNGPGILAGVASWLAGLPGMVLGWLGDIGSTLLGWLVSGFDWLVSNAISAAGNLVSFFLSDLPLAIAGWLGEIGPKLVDWIKAGWDWLVENGPSILAALADWTIGLPGKIIGWLGDIGTLLFDWIKKGWDWLVENGPTILARVTDWLLSLPGKFLGLLGNIGTLLVDWLRQGFQWVVDNGPSIIQGVIDFFSGLPGRIFDAIRNGLSSAGGAVTDLAKSLYNAVAGFVNDHLINPVRDFKVSVLGQGFTPFQGIPSLPMLAKGAIIDEPTLAVIGEAGREAAVPLDNEAAGVRVAQAAGIPGMLARAGALPSGGVEVYVTVEPPAGADQAWARSIGEAIGDAAGDAAARKLRLRAAVRSA